MQEHKANREIKSSSFINYFEEPKRFLSLYNAITGLNLPSNTVIEFKTLDNVLFYGKLNDIAAMINDRIIFLIEHQSSINENMALRILIYLGRVYEKIIGSRQLYGEKTIKIPKPEFIVLYNGVKPYPKEKTIRLSDSFIEGYTNFDCHIELEVKVININFEENKELIQRSRYLSNYSYFTETIRSFQKQGIDYTAAVVMAVKQCIKDNVMTDYLRENSSEVINMLTEEFDMDIALEVRYEEGMEKGIEKGIERGRLDMLNKLNKLGVSQDILEKAMRPR